MGLVGIAGKDPGKEVGASISLGLLHHPAIGVIQIGQICDAARVGDRGQLILVRIGIGGNSAIEISNGGKPAHRVIRVLRCPANIIRALMTRLDESYWKLNVTPIGRGDLRQVTARAIQIYLVPIAVHNLNHSLALRLCLTKRLGEHINRSIFAGYAPGVIWIEMQSGAVEKRIGACADIYRIGPTGSGGDAVKANARATGQNHLLICIRECVPDDENVIGLREANAEGARETVIRNIRARQIDGHNVRKRHIVLL
jgi:hypothetical protein